MKISRAQKQPLVLSGRARARVNSAFSKRPNRSVYTRGLLTLGASSLQALARRAGAASISVARESSSARRRRQQRPLTRETPRERAKSYFFFCSLIMTRAGGAGSPRVRLYMAGIIIFVFARVLAPESVLCARRPRGSGAAGSAEEGL